MKKIYILVVLLLASIACEDPFDLTRKDIISEDIVFEDEGLANAFLADLYSNAQFQIITGQSNFNMNLINSFGGEARNFAPWQAPFGQVIGPVFNEQGAGALNYWPYAHIRETNEFITRLPGSSSLGEDFIAVRVAEARFIRAHAYFEMVKRYGGIPLVTEALPIDASEEELFVSRNSEKEIYDFIGSEMDEIVDILPSVADQDGRATRWAALALKSRAMLYAASIAQFGSVQLDGLLGIPSGEANTYYQRSLDASREIITNGPFSLYRKQSDPVQNFTDLFTDENGNPEVIFAEKWDALAGKGHDWDLTAHPDGFGFSWNSNYPVYLETLELFDFMDGTSGKVDRSMYDDTTPIDPNWFFGQRDPRMRASISHPGMSWRGKTVHYHRSTDYTDPADGLRKRSASATFIIPGSDDWPGAGPRRNINAATTSLQIRKRLDENLPATGVNLSSTDFYVFRLGEIMLNYVEAAFYLGDPNGDMANILNNEIRDRAGMPALSGAEITEDKIRQERRVELAFEAHSFWDLRRWRIAVQELDGVVRHRMHFRYDYDDGTYTIAIADGDRGRVRSHQERNYYYALGLARLADNPKLIENPGY
ncbi:RagB/SusD family nutrient uptake outer membrane protein [Fulvivirgaceae bacterium BMA10]|uniref:RagB/SusD family nutrient uptake outer membrane protein n=1 Tax=Splendidivirga corallicola TaxID=3051826 RepID=A0ABT8KN47_9BACT|nr:RagB/SusD family nutrient uptake outer membrane protein [Fulvivirgaceae bacterium BMA10]